MTLKTFLNHSFGYEKIELLDFISGKILFEGDNFMLSKRVKNNITPNYKIVNIRSCITREIIDNDDTEEMISGFVIQVKRI